MREHERMVLRVALRMTGRLDQAQDAAQETFLRAYRAYRVLGPEANVRAWLFTIATT